MTIVLGVLLGLLSTLGAVAHAMTISRQRTIAVSLAKQTIENIQGADWANVATGTGVTTADPLVTPGTPLKFGGEDLFFGGTSPYRTYPVAAGRRSYSPRSSRRCHRLGARARATAT